MKIGRVEVRHGRRDVYIMEIGRCVGNVVIGEVYQCNLAISLSSLRNI